jgi:UDP-N-acetylmuramoylalanine--D-glutamate ligase
VKKTVETFHGIPFRLENRGTKKGITYINDTTASTPTAAVIAIRAMDKPTCIIVGGQTKKLPMEDFIQLLVSSPWIRKIVILGAREERDFVHSLDIRCRDKIAGQVFSMQEAVAMATQVASPGWNVLLSPGFTSFDLFSNEFDRGRQFNECVELL